MASSDEGGAEIAGLRKRIEYGLTLLGKEANASTRERMKAAIQADRERLRQLASDQTSSRKPQRVVPERSKSKVWEIIEEASRYQEDEHQQDDTTSNSKNSFFPHRHPAKSSLQPEKDTTTTRPNNSPQSPRTPSSSKEEDEKRRVQIIAELQRRREVLLSQLNPDLPAPKPPTTEERQRAEVAEKRKREQSRLDLKTAMPRERSAGGGVTYALVSPTVGSSGPDVHVELQRAPSTGAAAKARTTSTIPTEIMKEPQRTAVPTFRVSSSASAAPAGSGRKRSSSRATANRHSSTSVDKESRTCQRPQQQSQHRHRDPRSPRSDATTWPPRSRADRPLISNSVCADNEQHVPRLRRRDSEQSSSTASSSNRPSNDRMRRATSTTLPRHCERDRDRRDDKKSGNGSSISSEAPRRTRHRSLSRDDGRRSKVPPPAPAPPVPGSLYEQLLRRGPWRTS